MLFPLIASAYNPSELKGLAEREGFAPAVAIDNTQLTDLKHSKTSTFTRLPEHWHKNDTKYGTRGGVITRDDIRLRKWRRHDLTELRPVCQHRLSDISDLWNTEQ